MTESPVVAQRQAGVFTRRQARAAGWSAYQVRRRLQVGTWRVLLGHGLVTHGLRITPAAAGWAAHLSVPGSVVSHATAGALFGFPLGTPEAAGRRPVGHVVTDRHEVPAGIRAHRVPLRPDEVTVIGGLPTTTRSRTALDCLASSSPDGAVRLWAWVSTRGVLDVGGLATAVRSRTGRHGTPVLLELLRLVAGGAASHAEAVLHALLHRAGITGWSANAPVHDAHGRIIAVADVLFDRARLVLEVDGFAAHTGAEAFVRDRRRQNDLMVAGYRVLRITWPDLTRCPDAVIAQVRSCLRTA